jgi:hypothetical protein
MAELPVNEMGDGVMGDGWLVWWGAGCCTDLLRAVLRECIYFAQLRRANMRLERF